MRANASVGRWAGSFLGGLLIFLVAGCVVPFETDNPYDSTLLGSESLVGSKKELIREKIGEPQHELRDRNEDKSYFIYRRFGGSWGLAFLWFVPVGMVPSDDMGSMLHCALLEFDQNDILKRYDIKTRSEFYWSPLSQNDCRSLFWSEGELAAFEDLQPERIAKLKADCNSLLSRAMGMNSEVQLEMARSCGRFDDLLSWKWTCFAAHQGDHNAQYDLGHYYRRGSNPVQRDPVEAYKWLTLAAKDGDAATRGYRDVFARQLTPDQIAEAERLVAEWEPNPAECELSNEEIQALEAKAKAESEAEVLYETAYREDTVVDRWPGFCRAALLGHPKAQYQMGNYYRFGYPPVMKDLERAYVWYTVAGDVDSAMRFRADVAEQMTSEEVAEAERSVAEWQPNSAECDVEVVSTGN